MLTLLRVLVKVGFSFLFLGLAPLFAVENFDRVEKIDDSKFTSKSPYISIYFQVFDKEGKFIKDLKRNEIRLLVNQQIREDFSLRRDFSSDKWLLVTVVADISGSMKGQPLIDEKKALKNFARILGIYDKISFITFNEIPRILIPFTRDKEACIPKIDSITTKGNTSLYDAVKLSLELAGENRAPRKAIVVLSDGIDTNSKIKYETVLKEIKEAEIPIFTIGLGKNNENVLKRISKMSGGKYFFSPTSDDLLDIYLKIGENLKNAVYVIDRLKLYDVEANALYRIEITNLRTGKHIARKYVPRNITFSPQDKTTTVGLQRQNEPGHLPGVQNITQVLVGKNIYVTIVLIFFVIAFIGLFWFYFHGKFLVLKLLITLLSILLYFILQWIIFVL
jgi:VWFA-related protein